MDGGEVRSRPPRRAWQTLESALCLDRRVQLRDGTLQDSQLTPLIPSIKEIHLTLSLQRRWQRRRTDLVWEDLPCGAGRRRRHAAQQIGPVLNCISTNYPFDDGDQMQLCASGGRNVTAMSASQHERAELPLAA